MSYKDASKLKFTSIGGLGYNVAKCFSQNRDAHKYADGIRKRGRWGSVRIALRRGAWCVCVRK